MSLAIATSNLRRVLSSQSEQVKMGIQTVDDELLALSANHQGSHLPNGMTALILSVFAVLGGAVFSFDVQDAQEEDEAGEPCMDEPSKEIARDDCDEQQSEAQSPALWPCTLFQLRGFMRSAIVVISVLSVAIVTTQLRRALASQGEQLKMEVQSADEELMAMSAKHQGSQLPNGVTALILSIFAILGGVVSASTCRMPWRMRLQSPAQMGPRR